MGVILARYASGAARLGWAHTMFIPLLLVLCAPAAGGGWFDIVAVLLVFPALLLAASQAFVSRRLDPLWQQLGLLSYPVYVVHYPFVVVISNLFKSSHAGVAASWLGAMVTILVVLVFSALAARFYDAPVRALASRRFAAPLATGRAD